MSVTFTIEANPTGAFEAKCYDEGKNTVVAAADSYEGILPQIEAHKALCDECGHYGLYSQSVMDVSDDLDVNLSNMNARLILDILGIDGGEELVGSVPGDVFLGAVMLAQAGDRDDSGVADVVTVTARGTRLTDCGLPAGYYARTFGNLRALAEEAARLGRDITFA
jgi:hypothetical protein